MENNIKVEICPKFLKQSELYRYRNPVFGTGTVALAQNTDDCCSLAQITIYFSP
jgi:hypothetical protein